MARMPVYTPTLPPGKQKAFISLLSKTTNSHCALGKSFEATAAIRRPTLSTNACAETSRLAGICCFIFWKLARPNCISSAGEMRFNCLRPVTGTVEQPFSPQRIDPETRRQEKTRTHFAFMNDLTTRRRLSQPDGLLAIALKATDRETTSIKGHNTKQLLSRRISFGWRDRLKEIGIATPSLCAKAVELGI